MQGIKQIQITWKYDLALLNILQILRSICVQNLKSLDHLNPKKIVKALIQVFT